MKKKIPMAAVHPDRHGARHHRRLHDLHELPGQEDRHADRRLHLDPVGHLPAPDQDADRAAGVLDAGGRHRAHGRRRLGRPRLRQGARLVRHRFARLAGARPGARQPAAARQEPRAAAARHRRRRPTSRPRQVHAEGFRQPPGAEVVRRGDGQQRDPADRRVLDVLRRGAGGAGRERQDAGRRDRRARARHAQDHRLRDEARAARGVRGDGGDRRDERPRDPAQVRRLHGRLLPRPHHACGACWCWRASCSSGRACSSCSC